MFDVFRDAHRRELRRFRAARPRLEKSRAARQYLATLAGMMRFAGDLGFSPEQVASGLDAANRAMLKAWLAIDPITALRVANETRQVIRETIDLLTDDDA